MTTQPDTSPNALSSSSSAPASLDWRWIAFPLLFLIVALQIDTLTRHSLWNDEFITLRAIALDYAELVRNRLNASHVPGYFVTLKAWTSLVGLNDATLRFPSALCSLLGILLVWRLGSHLYGERVGVFVLALAGLNQIHIEQGGNARMYAALFLAGAGALYGLILYLDRGRIGSLIVLVLAGILGISMHLLYVFVPVSAGIYLLLRRNDFTDRRRTAMLALLLPLLLAAPVVYSWFGYQRKLGGHDQYQMFGLRDAFLQTCIIFTGDTRGSGFKALRHGRVVFVLVALLVAAAAVWKSRRAPIAANDPLRHLDLLLIWICVPMLVLAIGEIFSNTNVAGLWRYYVTQAAAAPLVFAAAGILLQRKFGKRVVGSIALAIVAMMAINTAGYMISPETGLREVAFYVRDRRAPDEPIIVSRAKTRSLAFTYYAGFPAVPPPVPEEIEDPQLVADWVRDYSTGNDQLWAVFYDDLKKDKLYRAIQRQPEVFEPVGEIFKHGDTAVGLYRITNMLPNQFSEVEFRDAGGASDPSEPLGIQGNVEPADESP